jgi:cytochrome c5
MGRSTAVLIAAGLLTVFVFAGCSDTGRTQPPEQAERGIRQKEEGPAEKPETKAEETGEKALDGKALLQERCTRCHGLDRVEKHARVDREHWANIVREMMRKGAKLNDDERNALLDYLAGR